MIVHVVVRPGVMPLDRGEIEDKVVEALGAGAESVGGGTLTDVNGGLVESDFDIAVPEGDRETMRALVVEVLRHIRFSMPTDYSVDIFNAEQDEDDDEDISDAVTNN